MIPIVPEIVVEVISPSETPRMINRRLKQYFAAGVKEAWLIYPETHEVEIWTGPTPPDHALADDDTLDIVGSAMREVLHERRRDK